MLEAIRQSPARYAVPTGMTLFRLPAALMTVHHARRGEWGKAGAWMAGGVISDKESVPADILDARSDIGAVIDPIFDGVLRAGGAIAFEPHMHPAAFAVTVGAEIDSLRMNKTIQKGEEHPIVPLGAKIGTGIEGAGAVVFIEGLRRHSKAVQTAGQLLLATGAVTRWGTYASIYERKIKAQK